MSKTWLFLAVLLLYLTNLGSVGFLGPDEPRYASIGREMAQSGDWVTPKLDGSPWFEKPPLLYWMTAIGHRLHLSDEWAARLPVALASLAFLLFFYFKVSDEFSPRAAQIATAILATSAGWLTYSTVAVTDLPMSAALGAAMLIAVFDTRPKQGYAAGILLGLAILGKGFVPVVLIGPVFLIARGKRAAMVIGSVLVAAPWYILCAIRNPHVFWNEFFWRHHVERFLHPTFEHQQPWWYYVPVLIAGLFPWTPLVGLLARPRSYDDERVRFLLFWLIYALVFFSIPQTKLPGYILPLLPALALVLAVSLDRLAMDRIGTDQPDWVAWWVAPCVILLGVIPLVVQILPQALFSGLTNTRLPFALEWPFLLGALVVAAAVFWLAWSGNREWAVIVAMLAAVSAFAYFKSATFPVLDQKYSVRGFWRENQAEAATSCWDHVSPVWVYGLSYYAGHGFPECVTYHEPVRVIGYEGKLRVFRER